MSTYTCEICSEEKRLGEMTLCGNGHFGGCQKCHMQFVKTEYNTSRKAYSRDTMVQCCMFCREYMNDIQMGDNWAIKLSKLQPIMMYNNPEVMGIIGERITLNKFVADYYSTYESAAAPPVPFDYNFYEKFIDELKPKDAVSKICKVIGKLDKDESVKNLRTLFLSYFPELDDR